MESHMTTNCRAIWNSRTAAVILTASLGGACSHSMGQAVEQSELVSQTVVAGRTCLQAVHDSGASKNLFNGKPDWISVGEDFRHRELPIEIRFPRKSNGTNLECEVITKLPRSDLALLTAQLEAQLGVKTEKPMVGDYLAWFVTTKEGQRALFLYSTNKIDGAEVRLVAIPLAPSIRLPG